MPIQLNPGQLARIQTIMIRLENKISAFNIYTGDFETGDYDSTVKYIARNMESVPWSTIDLNDISVMFCLFVKDKFKIGA